MKTLDITVDLETCALCPTAAVMSIGAVAWDRYGHDIPFLMDEDGRIDKASMFYLHVNIASEFVDHFTFDDDTSYWWSRQNEKAKQALLEPDETPLRPIWTVIEDFLTWIRITWQRYEVDDICLWSQGTDFDVAILRNICYKYKIDFPVKYTNFRDHRTYVMERGAAILQDEKCRFDNEPARNPRAVYDMIPALDHTLMEAQAHNPIYDCMKSINSTWYMMNLDK